MLRLASDADVHGEIIRGLRRRVPEIDYFESVLQAHYWVKRQKRSIERYSRWKEANPEHPYAQT